MFTPDQERAARELLRVCRRGGRIGLANWTPEGFIGQLFKTIGRYLPPPAGARSPALWGTRARIAELFEAQAVSNQARSSATSCSATARRSTGWRSSGPITGRCSRRSPRSTTPSSAALERDLLALIARFNRSGDGSMVVPSEYLEIVIVRD